MSNILMAPQNERNTRVNIGYHAEEGDGSSIRIHLGDLARVVYKIATQMRENGLLKVEPLVTGVPSDRRIDIDFKETS